MGYVTSGLVKGSRRAIYVDPHPDPDLIQEPCPANPAVLHTAQPKGFLERIDWREEIAKTHVCHRCEACGLWSIWAPKP